MSSIKGVIEVGLVGSGVTGSLELGKAVLSLGGNGSLLQSGLHKRTHLYHSFRSKNYTQIGISLFNLDIFHHE